MSRSWTVGRFPIGKAVVVSTCLCMVLGSVSGQAQAQSLQAGDSVSDVAKPTGWALLSDGWLNLANGWRLLDTSLILLMSLLLGAVIAYHPSTRRRMSSLEHFEQPKTFLMYSMVAAIVAVIVKENSDMALVIFGIGGLLRFRTMVGEAKDTGRVILVTVLGLCCGLKFYSVALPATVIGWLVIYRLEQQVAGTIRVSGVSEELMPAASIAYRRLIELHRCSIIGEQSKFNKRQFLFVVKAPPDFDRESLQSQFDELTEELRGKVDWEHL